MRFKMTGSTKGGNGRRRGFRRRIPSRLLSIARNFKTTFHFQGKYGEPDYHPEINPTHEIKFSLNTSNDMLSAEESIEALQQFNQLIQKMDGAVAPLEDFQIASYARSIFDFYERVVDDPRWKVDNTSTIKSFNTKLKAAMIDISLADEDEQEEYTKYKDILPFAESKDWQDFFWPINNFYEESIAPLLHLPVKGEDDPSTEAIFFRTGAMTRWWLKLKSIQPSAADLDRIMLAVERIRSKSEYVGFSYIRNAHSKSVDSARRIVQTGVKTTSIENVFIKWGQERDYNHNTMRAWHPYMKKLDAFVDNKGIEHLSRQDLIKWKDHLLHVEAKTPKNVRNNYLKAISVILGYAHQNNMIENNPLKEPIMKAQHSSQPNQQPYTDREIGLILAAASDRELDDRFRWVSWILAATGARVSEITQLGRDQIIQENGIWLFDIRESEDGASIKNKQSRRRVPIHKQIVDAGFLDYVLLKQGPIFYKQRTIEKGKTHPSSSVASSHADWIKTLADRGIIFKNKSPNHSIRKWFSTHQLEIGVLEGVTARIQGHKLPGEREIYVGKDLIAAMDAAINKIDLNTLCSDAQRG